MKENFVIYESKFGPIEIRYKEDKVTFIKKVSIKEGIREKQVPSKLTDEAIKQLEEYIKGTRKQFNIPYTLIGTEFQVKVWNALKEIPYGETRTYKDIAIQIGNPKASRAVGMANNKNPITILVPCHRVIGANGKLVGYAGGLEMKEELLNIEFNK